MLKSKDIELETPKMKKKKSMSYKFVNKLMVIQSVKIIEVRNKIVLL